VVRKGRDSEREEVYVARIAALAIGAIAIAIAIVGGSDLNVSYMVGLAFAVAASANFPALLLALTWKRFNTTGAVTGVLAGVVTSIGLVLLGPDVRTADPLIGLTQPAIISVPIGFLGCIVGTLLSGREARAERGFPELLVRSETGLGAEMPLNGSGNGAAAPVRRQRERQPVGAGR
jgi:cation/acetate symporter